MESPDRRRHKALPAPPPPREPLLGDRALQGGGAHGAFIRDVIDRLLEEPWPGFDGISGTSAGTMNVRYPT
jgi:predicted acylesterase/phospholipase RssA